MSTDANLILGYLETVAAERLHRQSDPELAHRVVALKTYQQRRFAKTYADLLESRRYGGASTFFLQELYGPRDFADRDAQFARVVPALVRLFPKEIIATVRSLAQLHALSEKLDTATAGELPSSDVSAVAYVRAWQAVGHENERIQQIELTLSVGRALDRLTRNPLLRHTLRMMRGPAKTAGLSELQHFLETGFDAFKAIDGACDFLSTIEARERHLAKVLFEAPLYADGHLGDIALGQLP